MKKKHQIIILPTDGKSNIYMSTISKHLDFKEAASVYSVQGQGQHLYILSDEEIKDGDFIFWNEIVDKFTFNTSDDNSDGWIGDSLTGCSVRLDDCKKIIATTNPELYEIPNTIPGFNFPDKKGLPKIPQDFIKNYIKAYNKGNPIKEVMVGYEQKDFSWVKDKNLYPYTTKTSHQNHITLHKVEQKTYTENDMREAFKAGCRRGYSQRSIMAGAKGTDAPDEDN